MITVLGTWIRMPGQLSSRSESTYTTSCVLALVEEGARVKPRDMRCPWESRRARMDAKERDTSFACRYKPVSRAARSKMREG